VGGVELPEEPFVEGAKDGVLAEGDVAEVLDVAGQAVLSGEAARVIQCGVGPVALHAPVPQSAYQQAAQRVIVLGSVRLVLAAAAAGEHLLNFGEGVVADQRRVDDLL
jgi:hypothetical protein